MRRKAPSFSRSAIPICQGIGHSCLNLPVGQGERPDVFDEIAAWPDPALGRKVAAGDDFAVPAAVSRTSLRMRQSIFGPGILVSRGSPRPVPGGERTREVHSTAGSARSSPFYSNAEAAAFLNLSPRTLEKMRVVGGGPRFRKFGRRVFYAFPDLEDWAARRICDSTSDPAWKSSASRG